MSEKNTRWSKLLERVPGRAVAYTLIALILSLLMVGLYVIGRVYIAKDAYSQNLYTEFLGVVLSVIVTVFIVDNLKRRLDEKQREQEREHEREQALKERLQIEIRSPQMGTVLDAFHEMLDRGFLYGENSILRGQFLAQIKPIKVSLRNTRLDGVNLDHSDFSKSDLYGVNLDNARLKSANLSNANLWRSSLKNADLENADLSEADLICANLEGANLLNASFKFPHLYVHWLNEQDEMRADPDSYRQLILPDGTQATPDTDLSRFTDPEHPDFWRSDDPESPAYRGHYDERLAMFKRMSENRPTNLPPPPTPPPAGGDAG